MSKPPGPGTCTYCLMEVEKRNWDHVFPKSWYPDTTPEDIERPKVPSCEKCNSDFGKVEKELLEGIGLCLSPDALQSKGIPQKAIRANKAELGKNDKDKLMRAGKGAKLRQSILKHTNIPQEGLLPNLGKPKSGAPLLTVPISAKLLSRFGEKVMRGFLFCINGQLIHPTHEIKTIFCKEEDIGDVNKLFNKWGELKSYGPGIEVTYAFLQEPTVSGFVKLKYWGSLIFNITVLPRSIEPGE